VLVHSGQLEYARSLYKAYFESDGTVDYLEDDHGL